MNTTYKTYVKPLTKYGSEVLITASNSTLQALETTQNNALRLITGGVQTTPILAPQLYTGHLTITCELKQQAAVSLTKIKALAQTTWATKTLDQQHLKTTCYPSTVYSYLKQLQIPTEVEPLCLINAPTEYQSFHNKLSLLSEIKKHDTPSTALQQL